VTGYGGIASSLKVKNGATPLHAARHKRVVHILLDQGADINVKDTAEKNAAV